MHCSGAGRELKVSSKYVSCYDAKNVSLSVCKMTQNKNGSLPNRCKRFKKTRVKVTRTASKMCGMSRNLNTWVSLTV